MFLLGVTWIPSYGANDAHSLAPCRSHDIMLLSQHTTCRDCKEGRTSRRRSHPPPPSQQDPLRFIQLLRFSPGLLQIPFGPSILHNGPVLPDRRQEGRLSRRTWIKFQPTLRYAGLLSSC